MQLVTPKWNETNEWWPKIEKWIAPALRHGGVFLTPESVYRGLCTREMKLWLALEGDELRGCAVTQPINYPLVKVLYILALGGERAVDWLGFVDEIRTYAQHLDCEAIEFVGRQGWMRKGAPFGAEPYAVIYRIGVS